MSFFKRLATVIKSNLNDLINKAEDPEKMLDQILIDMREQLVEAKKQVAVAIADEKRLQKQYAAGQQAADDWEQRAMMAVRAGDDELAKEALRRQREEGKLATQLKEQWERQAHSVEQLKRALRALNNKIDEANRKKGVLVARKRRAEAMRSIEETMSGLSDTSAFDAFSRMEERINQSEAEAEAASEMNRTFATSSLKERFDELEHDAGADMALDDLKRRMGVLPPTQPTRVAQEPAPSAEQADDMAELEAALQDLKARELGSDS